LAKARPALLPCFLLALILGATTTAVATPVTFFGGDPSGNLTNHPNSDATAASFLATLVSPLTYNFEDQPSGITSGITATFGPISASVSYAGGPVDSGINNRGLSNSKSWYWWYDSMVTFTFDTPIHAFGFYGIDFNTTINGETMTVGYSDGSSDTVVFYPQDGGYNNVQYFGFYDTDLAFTTVTLQGPSDSGEYWGMDNVTVATGVVPEPATLLLLGGGLLGLSGLRKKARKRGDA
jgi:hypothetical protein